MKGVRFTKPARQEFLSAITWYDAARPGLGKSFVAAVETVAARALAFPLGGAPAAAGTHRMVLVGFPFSLYYKPRSDGILVVALAHHARRPRPWDSEHSE